MLDAWAAARKAAENLGFWQGRMGWNAYNA